MFLDILKEHSYDFDQNTFFSFLMFIMQQKTWPKPYLQYKDLWVLSPVYNSTTDIQNNVGWSLENYYVEK